MLSINLMGALFVFLLISLVVIYYQLGALGSNIAPLNHFFIWNQLCCYYISFV